MPNTDLDKATRELFVNGLVDEVYMRTPVIEELKRRNQVTHAAGKYIERLIDIDSIEDLAQEYGKNDPLTDERKETLDKPRFTWKKMQLPLRYDVDEELENVGGGPDITLLNIAEHLVKKGFDGVRRWWVKKLFNSGSTTPVADGATGFQSLISALNHDTVYGTLSRSFSGGTHDEWQGADPAGLNESVASSSQDTAYTLTKGNLQKWINETSVADSMEGPEDLMICMCPTLWDKLANEMESHSMYKAGSKQSQGIKSMMFDGYEVVSVPYLQRTATMRTWLFILNLRYLELRIHSKRNERLTPFEWQGKNQNGYDCHLARIMCQGNICHWKPKSSMWLSAVS